MKKYAAFIIGVVTAVFMLTGCGDKKSEELVFTKLTVEQNKAKMQEEGLAAVEKMNGMSNLSGVFALKDLDRLTATSPLTGDPIGIAVRQLIAPLAQMDKNVLGVTHLRSTKLVIETIADLMTTVGGVYTYNPATESFNRVANASKIEFVFPIGSSVTNNGKLTIDNLTTKTSVNLSTELVKSLDMKLSKAGSELLSFNYTATFDADDVPTAWNTALSFAEGYKFTQSMVNTETDASWQFAYMLNKDNLLSGKFSSKGNFSFDVLNNTDGLESQSWINQLLDNANSYVQLGNLKLTGVVDVDKLMAAQEATFPEGIANTETDVNKACELLNSHVSLILLYVKEGTIIAKSNFYTLEYTNWGYDESIHEWGEMTIFEPSMQLLFKDGSAMDESFFTQGFEDLLTAYQEMLSSFQTSYAQ